MNKAEKSRLEKLLDGLETPELRLSEKCTPLVEEFKANFLTTIAEEDNQDNMVTECEEHTNPFVPNPTHLEEIDRKLMKLVSERKPLKQVKSYISTTSADPQRPWRINTGKEMLLRINNELRRHIERSNDLVTPLPDEEFSALVMDDSAVDPIEPKRLQEIVESAKKSFTNFQYRSMRENNDVPITVSGDTHADQE